MMIKKYCFVITLFLLLVISLLFTPSPNSLNLLESHHVSKLTQTQNLGTIVFDYSHGQYSNSVAEDEDTALESTLEVAGYSVIWENDSLTTGVLDNAVGLVIGSILGAENGFTEYELSVISFWFNSGKKFMWIAGDSDYASYSFINDNMTAILERIGSHVYLEPTDVYDEESNCGAPYRVIATGVGSDYLIEEAIVNVDSVLLHGPTLLYGSTSANPIENAVPLEDHSIDNVYPLLMYAPSAKIIDSDSISPIAHTNEDVGAFVAVTLETNTGLSLNSTLVVSGASPYGDFQPMFCSEYYSVNLTGDIFVYQTIHLGMQLAARGITTTTTTNTTPDTLTGTTTNTKIDDGHFSFFSIPILISLVSCTVIIVCVVLIVRNQKK